MLETDTHQFFNFLRKVTVLYKLKIDLMELVWKNLVLRLLDQKWSGKGPKWGFSGIVNNQCMNHFQFCAWRCSGVKFWNWHGSLLGKNGLKFLGQQGPKMDPKQVFQVLWKTDTHKIFWFFYMRLQQHKFIKLTFWLKIFYVVFGLKGAKWAQYEVFKFLW